MLEGPEAFEFPGLLTSYLPSFMACLPFAMSNQL
jgi:hypothetical protein